MDENIIEQAKNGSKLAINKLLQKYNRFIRRTVKSLVKDDCFADEIICTVMIKLYKNINKYTKAISFEAWIKTIAINSCIDFFRTVQNNRNKVVPLNDIVINSIDSYAPSGEECLINTNISKDVQAAIDSLPKRRKRVVELYFFENKQYKEIAKLLSIPEGTVKSDLSRSKQKLKTILQNYQS